MDYYKACIELMEINDRLLNLYTMRASSDSVRVSKIKLTPASKRNTIDTIGKLLSNREEIETEIDTLHKKQKSLADNIDKVIHEIIMHYGEKILISMLVTYDILILNMTITEVARIKLKSRTVIQNNLRAGLKRIKEYSEINKAC